MRKFFLRKSRTKLTGERSSCWAPANCAGKRRGLHVATVRDVKERARPTARGGFHRQRGILVFTRIYIRTAGGFQHCFLGQFFAAGRLSRREEDAASLMVVGANLFARKRVTGSRLLFCSARGDWRIISFGRNGLGDLSDPTADRNAPVAAFRRMVGFWGVR